MRHGGVSVAVLDSATQSILTSLPAGDRPRSVDVTADGTRLYCAGGENDFVVIDATTDTPFCAP